MPINAVPKIRLFIWTIGSPSYWAEVKVGSDSALMRVRLIDKIGAPREVELIVNNRQPDISSSTASDRKGVHDSTFRPFAQILLVDDESHIIIFTGAVHEIERKYDIIQYGNHLIIKAYDILRELATIDMGDPQEWWYPKKGRPFLDPDTEGTVIVSALANPSGTTPSPGTIRTSGNASSSFGHNNTRTGLIKHILDLSGTTSSSHRITGTRIVYDDYSNTGGIFTPAQMERSAFAFPTGQSTALNAQVKAVSALAALRMLSENDGHSASVEDTGLRGYDYYISPNITTPKPNSGNWTDAGNPHLNYFQRGTRPHNVPASKGLNLVYPRTSAIKEQALKPGHSTTHNAQKFILPDFDFGDANKSIFTHVAVTFNAGLNQSAHEGTVTSPDNMTKQFELLYVYNIQGGGSNNTTDFYWRGRLFDEGIGGANVFAYDHPVQPSDNNPNTLAPAYTGDPWDHTSFTNSANETAPVQQQGGTTVHHVFPRKVSSGTMIYDDDVTHWGGRKAAASDATKEWTERVDGTPTSCEPLDLWFTTSANASQSDNSVSSYKRIGEYDPSNGNAIVGGKTQNIGWIQYCTKTATNSYQGTNTEAGTEAVLISQTKPEIPWYPAVHASGWATKVETEVGEIPFGNPGSSSFVILRGRYSGATCRLNLSVANNYLHTGRPLYYVNTKRVAGVNLAGVGFEGGATTLSGEMADAHRTRDKIRVAAASTIIKGLKEIRQGTYKVMKYPYHTIDLTVGTITSTGSQRTIQFEEPDGTGNVNLSVLGVKRGDPIKFYGTDSTFTTETVYGYVKTISTSTLLIHFTETNSSVVAGHYCRAYVPLRASHTIRVDADVATVTGNHIVQELEFTEDTGRAMTSITSIGENTDLTQRSVPPYIGSPNAELFQKINRPQTIPQVPPGSQNIRHDLKFDWVNNYESNRMSWTAGILNLGDGRKIEINAGSTLLALGNNNLPSSPVDVETNAPISFYIYCDLEEDPRNLKMGAIYQPFVLSGSVVVPEYVESLFKVKLWWVRNGPRLAEWGTANGNARQGEIKRADSVIESGTVTALLQKPGAQPFKTDLKIRGGAVANLASGISNSATNPSVALTSTAVANLAGSIGNFLNTYVDDPDNNGQKLPRYLRIDDEIISYTGISSYTFTGVTRGAKGSTAVAHTANAIIWQPQWDRISWYKENAGATSGSEEKTHSNVTTAATLYLADADVGQLDGSTSAPSNPSLYIAAGSDNRINIGTKIGGGSATPTNDTTWEVHKNYNTYYLFITIPETNIDTTTGQVYYGSAVNSPPTLTLTDTNSGLVRPALYRTIDYWRPYGDRNVSLGTYTIGQDQSATVSATAFQFEDQEYPSVLSIGTREPILAATMLDANIIKGDHIQASGSLTSKHELVAPTYKTGASVRGLPLDTLTPHTSFEGHGILIDKSGIYGLNNGVLQWSGITNASDDLSGKIGVGTASTKKVVIDSTGLSITESGSTASIQFRTSDNTSVASKARIYTANSGNAANVWHFSTADGYNIRIGTATDEDETAGSHDTEAIILDSNYLGITSQSATNDATGAQAQTMWMQWPRNNHNVNIQGSFLRVSSTANRTIFGVALTPVHTLSWVNIGIETLTNTPSNLGSSGQVLAVNSAENALEWVDNSGSGGGAITDAFRFLSVNDIDSGYTWSSTAGSNAVASGGADVFDFVAGSGIKLEHDTSLKAMRTSIDTTASITTTGVWTFDGGSSSGSPQLKIGVTGSSTGYIGFMTHSGLGNSYYNLQFPSTAPSSGQILYVNAYSSGRATLGWITPITTWYVAADEGTAQAMSQAEYLDFDGGDAIDTEVSTYTYNSVQQTRVTFSHASISSGDLHPEYPRLATAETIISPWSFTPTITFTTGITLGSVTGDGTITTLSDQNILMNPHGTGEVRLQADVTRLQSGKKFILDAASGSYSHLTTDDTYAASIGSIRYQTTGEGPLGYVNAYYLALARWPGVPTTSSYWSAMYLDQNSKLWFKPTANGTAFNISDHITTAQNTDHDARYPALGEAETITGVWTYSAIPIFSAGLNAGSIISTSSNVSLSLSPNGSGHIYLNTDEVVGGEAGTTNQFRFGKAETGTTYSNVITLHDTYGSSDFEGIGDTRIGPTYLADADFGALWMNDYDGHLIWTKKGPTGTISSYDVTASGNVASGESGHLAYYATGSTVDNTDKIILNTVGYVRIGSADEGGTDVTPFLVSQNNSIGTAAEYWHKVRATTGHFDVIETRGGTTGHEITTTAQFTWNSDLGNSTSAGQSAISFQRASASSGTPQKHSHFIEFSGRGYASGHYHNRWEIQNRLTANNASTSTLSFFEGSASGSYSSVTGVAQKFAIKSDGVLVVIETSTPGTPSSGGGYLYADSSDSKIKYKNDGGTVYDLTAGGGVTVNAAAASDKIAYYSSATTIDDALYLGYDASYNSNDGALFGASGAMTGNPFIGKSGTASFQGGYIGFLQLQRLVSSTYRTVMLEAHSAATANYTLQFPPAATGQTGGLLIGETVSSTSTKLSFGTDVSSYVRARFAHLSTELIVETSGTNANHRGTFTAATYNSGSGPRGSLITLFKSKNATFGTNTGNADNDDIGTVEWRGPNAGGTSRAMAEIRVVQEGAANSYYNGSRMFLRTSKAGSPGGVAPTSGVYATAATYQMVLDEGYGVGVHTVPSLNYSGNYSFIVTNGVSGSNYVGIGGRSGYYAIDISGNGYISGTWTYGSDERVKDNVATITGSDALTKLNALNPVSFDWAAKYISATPDKQSASTSGFLASEFATVFPQAVKASELDLVKKGDAYRLDSTLRDGESIDIENLKGIDVNVVIPYLVAAIKDLEARLKIVES